MGKGLKKIIAGICVPVALVAAVKLYSINSKGPVRTVDATFRGSSPDMADGGYDFFYDDKSLPPKIGRHNSYIHTDKGYEELNVGEDYTLEIQEKRWIGSDSLESVTRSNR